MKKSRSRAQEIIALRNQKTHYEQALRNEERTGRSPLLMGTYKRWIIRIEERLIELNASER